MSTEPITLEQQAEEADLTALEYEGFIRQVGLSRDPRVQRTPEQIQLMRFRLERKRAAAGTLRELAERAAQRAQRDAGKDAA